MFDRLFLPALTFTVLVAGLAAFSAEIVPGDRAPSQIVQLERIVVRAPRALPETPVAQTDAERPATVVVR
jgi:hypothetical protein